MDLSLSFRVTFNEDSELTSEQKKQWANQIAKSCISSISIGDEKMYPCNICNKLTTKDKMKYFNRKLDIGVCNNYECSYIFRN